MLRALLSDDLPRNRVLSVILLVILIGLATAPFLVSGANAINTAAKICIFILLVASYDILLGYTGIVSFAHTMFFGIGGYGVGLAMHFMGATWGSALLGTGIAIVFGVTLAALIGLLSLRVKAIFFAMITLAVATVFAVLVSQLSDYTGGEDGRSFRVPELLRPTFKLLEEPVFGTMITGRVAAYYLVFSFTVFFFLLALRMVNSPFGRVLQAIRENEYRAEALGYRVVKYRTIATCLSAGLAVVAGALYALWLRYTGPDTTLSFAIMLNILLMVVIGGMGTLYGAVIGGTLFILAENYLQKLLGAAATQVEGIPVLAQILHPDRWLLILGVLFVLSVYFFPTGIVGKLRQKAS
ncbi:ABC transporter permease [Elstera litoralis]|uniref:ABC transporter permease n=1 Tax=Elstera litoralis TaxID=552518 RepID=A0A0F3IVL9_9PROT|nr:branched-chain amino acid ABC transporter permease [Elstera litoralis]KJV10800.1 ABC transporter permease [Elstera litoralis]